MENEWLRLKCLMVLLTILTAVTSLCRRRQLNPKGPSLCSDNITFGYSNLRTLRSDLSLLVDNGEPRTIILCQFTTFNVSSIDDGPLRFNLDKSPITIACGGANGRVSKQCILAGGQRQVFVESGRVQFVGLTFQNYTEYSIRVSPNSVASFNDCRWLDQKEIASFILCSETGWRELEQPAPSGTTNLHLFLRSKFGSGSRFEGSSFRVDGNLSTRPRSDRSGSWRSIVSGVSFTSCDFGNCPASNGDQDHGTISVGATASVRQNAIGAFVSSRIGKFPMKKNIFFNSSSITLVIANTVAFCPETPCAGIVSPGQCFSLPIRWLHSLPVRSTSERESAPNDTHLHREILSSVSPLQYTEGNPHSFSRRRLSDFPNNPSSILKLGTAERILIANSTSGQGVVPCPSDKTLVGYTDIALLQRDILFGKQNTFLLCPKVVFRSILIIQPPLLSTNVTLQCADLTSTCAWRGGQKHLVVIGRSGPLLNVRIEGIIFRNAKDVSVEVSRTPTTNVNINFANCRWEGGRGPASVWIKKVVSTAASTSKGRKLTALLPAGTDLNAMSRSRIERRRKSSGTGLSVTFTRCLFASLRGISAVAMENPSISRRLLAARSRRLAQIDAAKFDSCIFTGNVINGTVIESFYSTLSINGCLFADNIVPRGNLVNSVGGSATLQKLRFEKNVFNGASGLVSLQSQTITMEQVCTSNNTFVGKVQGSCKGALTQPDPKDCQGRNSTLPSCRPTCRPFVCVAPSPAPSKPPSTSPSTGTIIPSATPTKKKRTTLPVASAEPSSIPTISLSPSPTLRPKVSSPKPSRRRNATKAPTRTTLAPESAVPSDFPSSTLSDSPSLAPSDIPSISPSILPSGALLPDFGNCSRTWMDLSKAIQSHSTSSSRSTPNFPICSGAALVVGNPIVIDRPATVQCGNDGLRMNDCKILGGSVQFNIVATGVQLLGLRLMHATVVSILASGKANSTLGLIGCEWASNSGVASVVSYSGVSGNNYTALTDIGLLTVPREPSMGLDFNACIFSSNKATLASVVSVAGSIKINSTYFVNNTGGKASAVSASNTSSVSVSSSCFIDNVSQLPGSIFLDGTSRLLANNGNFGDGNIAGKKGQCTEIFQQTGNSCFLNGSCFGVCASYDSRTCKIPTSESPLGSSSPSLAPSRPPGSTAGNPVAQMVVLSTRSLGSSGIFLQTLGSSLFVLGGGIFSYFYLKKLAGKT